MDYFLTRMFLQKGLAFIYCIAFLIALNQYPALVGENGIAPMGNLRKITTFFRSPGLFIFHRSDRFIRIVALAGTALSLFALSGMSERYGLLVSSGVWLSLWFLYLSFVNAGGIFYGYGWEIMLLESGFLAVFLGSSSIAPSVLVIGLYRWVLFRMMFGSGMIKVRSGGAWKDLTAMIVHYETQPLPGPFSRLLHNLPSSFTSLPFFSPISSNSPSPFSFFGRGSLPRLRVVSPSFFKDCFSSAAICRGSIV